MVKAILLKFALLSCTLLIFSRIEAQTYAGISLNIGNRLNFSPQTDGFSRPVSFSGSLLLRVQEEVSEKWALQYGFDLGVLSYKLKVNPVDTLIGGDPYLFTEYSTFYAGFNLMGGRVFDINSKKLMVSLGGGASYYFSFIPTTDYGISIIYPGSIDMELFSASIESPSTRVLPFMKISAQLELNLYLTLGLEYTHHFGSMLDGTYEFYHTPTYQQGRVSLVPKELSLTMLVHISNTLQWFQFKTQKTEER